MQSALVLAPSPLGRSISPLRELGAYEALWLEDGATQKRIADRFRRSPGALPSDLVPHQLADETASRVVDLHRGHGVSRFGVRVHQSGDYPQRLRDARHPTEVVQYEGVWEITETRCVAVVGARSASPQGIQRSTTLSRALVEAGFTVVSGLARGIDTAAHTAAIEAGGRTIAVIGTPLSCAYPAENAVLQRRIADEHLLISEVPVCRYYASDWRANRGWFPIRNATMSALTEATVIVEASETSGTLTQARAALHQGRKLFILNSCFERGDLSWPSRLEQQGAVRIRNFDELADHLQ